MVCCWTASYGLRHLPPAPDFRRWSEIFLIIDTFKVGYCNYFLVPKCVFWKACCFHFCIPGNMASSGWTWEHTEGELGVQTWLFTYYSKYLLNIGVHWCEFLSNNLTMNLQLNPFYGCIVINLPISRLLMVHGTWLTPRGQVRNLAPSEFAPCLSED